MIGIYKIKNLINGKVYIGQSVNIERRWAGHRQTVKNSGDKSYDFPLYKSIRKYGIENFDFEVLEICKIEDLNRLEKKWMLFYSSVVPGGYNLQFGNNMTAKVTPKEVFEIIDFLRNTFYTNVEIGLWYNLCDDSVGLINNGKTWVNEDLVYPIRQETESKLVCPKCGEVKFKDANQCFECYNRARRHNIPKKEELEQELKKTNFVQVGKKYGVSDNAVRKWCRFYGISDKAKDYK